MNIIVLVKQMRDLEQIKSDPATGEPQVSRAPFKMETLSENAVEAAVQLKEKYGGKVTAIIFGDENSSQIMKKAYAVGVDDGIIITGYKENNPSYTAEVIAQQIRKMQHDIIILGNQSADSVSGLLPGYLSGLLKEPVLGNAISIAFADGKVSVKSIHEDSNVEEEAAVPVIVSVTQEINQPRLPPVMQIMQAGRKPITTVKADIQGSPISETISNRAPKSERKRIIFEDQAKGVEEVVKVIRDGMR